MGEKYNAELSQEYTEIVCERCNRKLEIISVKLEYLGSGFPVDLPGCPECGMIYIPEELALGKILHVEQSLEDK